LDRPERAEEIDVSESIQSDWYTGPPAERNARLASELRRSVAKLDPLVTLSQSAQDEILRFRERYDQRRSDEPLPPVSLRKLRKGSRRYLALQERLIALAVRYEPLARPDETSSLELDPTLRYAGVGLATAAALTLYDNYLSMLTIMRDRRLRRLINDPDLGYGIEEDELWELVERLNSEPNRRRLRKLIDAWDDAPQRLSPDAEDLLAPIRLTIESSVSYRYARAEMHLQPLPTDGQLRRARFLDRMEQLANDALGTVSELFGNGIGLVETRRGKLWEQEDIHRQVLETLRPLDLLLEKTPFRLTDYFIPGHFGHVAIWMGTDSELQTLGVWEQPGMQAPPFLEYRQDVADGRSVLEALRSGVELNTLREFLNVDDLAVLRPKTLPSNQVVPSLVRGFRQVGKEYDFNFDVETTGTIVCSELPYHVYPRVDWRTEEQLGRFTISPDDVALQALGEEAAFELVLFYHDGKQVEPDKALSTFTDLVRKV
jgi:hypothetical protein